MGWCSATMIFDAVCSAVLEEGEIDKKEIIAIVANALEDGNWDCQSDSAYYEDPIVQAVMREMHPRWFEDEG